MNLTNKKMFSNSLFLRIILLTIVLTSCAQQQTVNEEKKVIQSYNKQKPTAHHEIALEVIGASKEWITNFNKGAKENIIGGYAETAVMSAMPFGVYEGIEKIKGFWVPFVESGATDLVYTKLSIQVANEKTAFLSANWSMNVGHGVIYNEKWEKLNGKWVLTYDNFEVQEKYETPRKNSKNPIASHIAMEELIHTSIAWTSNFNNGKGNICGEGYFDNATMNPTPFPSITGKKGIENFWVKLIADGATNLIYSTPKFEMITANSGILSSDWSMNIGEGKIYNEKWEKKDGKWKLSYDEFKVLTQY